MTLDLVKMGTRLTEQQILDFVAKNPARLTSEGNVILPPCRLSFASLGTQKDKLDTNGNKVLGPDGQPVKDGYGASLLLIPQSDVAALVAQRAQKVREFFPNNPEGAGLPPLFKNQSTKVAPADGGENRSGKTFTGYVPGWPFITANANNRPGLATIVNGVPTAFVGTDEQIDNEFYNGCWVIPSVNIFHGKNTRNPGAFPGLQQVLKFADDTPFGSAGDRKANVQEFGGVAIDASINPAAAFGEPAGGAAAADPAAAFFATGQ